MMVPSVIPQLVGNAGLHSLQRAVVEPERYALDIARRAPAVWKRNRPTEAVHLGPERRERLELLATAFEPPVELSPVGKPCGDLARQMADGTIEGLVIKDRTSPYRDGGRSGCFKIKDSSWYRCFGEWPAGADVAGGKRPAPRGPLAALGSRDEHLGHGRFGANTRITRGGVSRYAWWRACAVPDIATGPYPVARA
jgi:hypothetical protein